MTDEIIELKKPRFYREPDEVDVRENGELIAEIHSRIRARIIGGRILSATVAASTGAVISAIELFNGNEINVRSFLTNFGVPLVVNTLAQLKVEKNLNNTSSELDIMLPFIEKVIEPTSSEEL